MSIVSLVIAPTLANLFGTKIIVPDAAETKKEQSIIVSAVKADNTNTIRLK